MRALRRLAAAVLTFSIFAPTAFSATPLQVVYDESFQVIEGFGASDAWSIDPTVNRWLAEGKEKNVEALADTLFSIERGIGLSAWRFNIGAGSAEQGVASQIPDPYRRAELFSAEPGGAIHPGKQAGQVRFLQEAHERGVGTLVAFVNSPPTWATKNGLAHPGTGEDAGSSNLRPDRLEAFSDFMVDVLRYLRGPTVDVPVNTISPANEPTWHWQGQSQEGNRYNNTDLKRLYRSLYSSLREAGLEHDIEIDGVEAPEYRVALSNQLHTELYGNDYQAGMNELEPGAYRNYIDVFLKDEEMRRILGNKLSLHAYHTDADAQKLGPLRDTLAQNLRDASPEARLWMSEYCVLGDTGDIRSFEGPGFDVEDMELALHVARIIHRDLTRLDVTAWFWWLALTPYDYKDGLLKIDADLNADSVRQSKLLWALGHFSRFVRPGYTRVALPKADDLHALMASAYRSPDDRELVIVAINAGPETQMVEWTVKGLSEGIKLGPPQIYLTNASGNHRQLTDTELRSLPGESIATLVFPLVSD